MTPFLSTSQGTCSPPWKNRASPFFHITAASILWSKIEPNFHSSLIATTLSNLGILDLDENRKEKARKAFEDALEIYEELAKHNSDRFAPDVERVQSLLNQVSR